MHPGDQQRLIGGRYRCPCSSAAARWARCGRATTRCCPPRRGQGAEGPAGHPAARGDGVRERMMREARALAGLSHPNVVTVFDVVDAEGEPLVVMELVPSRNLGTVITELGLLDRPQAAVGRLRHVGGTARGAPGRDHPPRRQAGQRAGRRRRAGQAHRLRDRPQRVRRADDDGGPGARLPRLHRAGGRRGPAGDARRRPVGAGRDAVRRGRGTAPVRRARRPGLTITEVVDGKVPRPARVARSPT